MQEVRRTKITELVKERGIIKISELSKIFKVSEITIHRDLQYLEKKGVLRKLHGGAATNPTEAEVQFPYRSQSCIEEKRKIALKVSELILEGDILFLDGSTTCVEVAKCIKDKINLTVFTNNPYVMYELINSHGVVLYFIGGIFSRDLECFVGEDVLDHISKLHLTKGIFGASAISPEFGITGPYQQLVSIQRQIIKVSLKNLVVADNTKFGKVALEKAADIHEIDYIITDEKANKEITNKLSEKTTVIIAL